MQSAGGAPPAFREILDLTEAYLDMLYASDAAMADSVFHEQAQLCTMEQGKPIFRSLEAYKNVLRERTPPKSTGALRNDRLISLDIASPTTAMVKVEMHVNEMVIVDYLLMMSLAAGWRIVAKTYHRLSG